MTKGQPVTTYLTTMKEYRGRLAKEVIPDSSHAATILHNVPESWRSIAQTIRMITRDINTIEERLEAHESDLNAVEISTQAATVFVAQSKRSQPAIQQKQQQPRPQFNNRNNGHGHQNDNRSIPRPTYSCNNCSKSGHSSSQCFAPGVGLAGQAPWSDNQGQSQNNPFIYSAICPSYTNSQSQSRPSMDSTQLASQKHDDVVMVASITESYNELTSTITLNTTTTALAFSEDNRHNWLIDSGTTSHLCRNIDLFKSIYNIQTVTIKTASGDAFTANQRGTVHITICSDPTMQLPDLPITLLKVIYTPKLNANLLLVGRMMHTNMDVMFHKHYASIQFHKHAVAHGRKVNNLFIFTALTSPKVTSKCIRYSNTNMDITLWHH